MKKKEIRKTYSNLRNEITKEQIEVYSNKISSVFFKNFNLDNVNYIHIFIPIKNKKEIKILL